MKKTMIAAGLILAILGCFTACGSSPEPTQSSPPVQSAPEPTPEPIPEPTVVTLTVCGDAMCHKPMLADAWDETAQAYDFTPMIMAAAPYAEQADYAVVNLETTLAGGPDYSGYPAFHSPDALAEDLKGLGFDLLLTANNHSLDKGYKGLARTLDVLDEVGLAHVGTSRTQAEAAEDFVLADVGGITTAFLGYSYGTNGIPVPKDNPYAINLFNTDYRTTMCTPDTQRILDELDAVKALEPDLIAVMIHWGVEYQTKQNAYQEELADLLFENGADLVLGGHPHVLQPMELRTLTAADGSTRQGFVCYSLGNFISAQNDRLTDTTVVLELELTRDNVTGVTQVTDYVYHPMLMLDREAGAEERFALLDVYQCLEEGTEPELSDRLHQAITDCHTILGAEHDAG